MCKVPANSVSRTVIDAVKYKVIYRFNPAYREMSNHTRRTFLKISGAALGGIATGTTVTAATISERFIVVGADEKDPSGVEVIHRLDQIDTLVVRGPEDEVKKLGGEYAPDLEYSLDLPVKPQQVPSATDEPLYPLQWDKQDQNIPEVHEITRGENTRVAVIDTGVAANHPDLQHAVNKDLSQNFTDDDYGAPGPYGGYHGSHVSGIIAANDQNEVGVVGSAPGTEVVDCRVFSPESLAAFSDIIAAMVYSAEIGCDAANLSIGAYPVDRSGNGKFYGKVLNSTTAYARRKGTLLVVSAGNAGADLQHDKGVISLPNEAANVMSISATGPVGFEWGESGLKEPFESPARYTNYGTNAVNIGAPGGDYDPDFPQGWYYDLVLNCVAIPSFSESGEYKGATYDYSWVAGTSMAAPQVTAAAALVRSVSPDYNANEVKSALEDSASVPEGFDKTYYGSGYLDPLGALKK
jgi:subtilisin family serine protease